MARQNREDQESKTSVVTARVTPDQKAALMALRKRLGSARYPLSEADALRHLMADGCAQYGVAWPAVDS
jgi:hypothetical protein